MFEVMPAVVSAVVTTAVTRMGKNDMADADAADGEPVVLSAAKRAAQLAAHPVYEQFERVDAGVWNEASQTPVVCGAALNGGLVYVGARLPSRIADVKDACLIDPNLPVEIPESPEIYDDPEPDYARMSPRQRGTWLKWLASGRRDAIGLSYLMLYFYGLERRLLIDGPAERFDNAARQSVVAEVLRLMRDFGHIASFGIVAQNLASLDWVLHNNPHFIERVPDFVGSNSIHSIGIFSWNLARHAIQHKPVQAAMMLEWYRNHPKFGLSADLRQHYDQLLQLFEPAFAQQFGCGYELRPGASPLILNYHAANPQNGDLWFAFPAIPDVFDNTDALDDIKNTVAECAQKLNAQNAAVHAAEAAQNPDAPDARDSVPVSVPDSLDAQTDPPETAEATIQPGFSDESASSLPDSGANGSAVSPRRESLSFDGSQDMLSFLREVAERPQWPRLEFFACALRYHLMADWCMRDINEWAAAHDMPVLITDGITVVVDQNHLSEIL